MLTKEEAAARLDGDEYGDEGGPTLFAEMKDAGLICLFGYSDDLIEIRGAFEEEVSMGVTHFTQAGLLKNECEEGDDCPYFAKIAASASKIEAAYADEDKGMFAYTTDIPHATFSIMEDGELYSQGIVFALADAAA